MDVRGIPKEAEKDTIPASPWSRAPPKDNQRLRQFPWQWATVGRTLATNTEQPTFQSSHILGAPNLTVGLPMHIRTANLHALMGRKPSQVLRTQNKINEKAIAVPGRERIHKQWGTQTKIHKPRFKRSNSYQCFSSANLTLEWKELSIYLPFSTKHHRWRSRSADLGKNSHPLWACASFPGIPSAGSKASGVSQQVSSWLPEIVKEET